MLENLSYNEFWGIFFTGSVLLLVGVIIWLFLPFRKYYLKQLKEEENLFSSKKKSPISNKNEINFKERLLVILNVSIIFIFPILLLKFTILVLDISLKTILEIQNLLIFLGIVFGYIFLIWVLINIIIKKSMNELFKLCRENFQLVESLLVGILTALLILFLTEENLTHFLMFFVFVVVTMGVYLALHKNEI